jgi:hypothetical protein
MESLIKALILNGKKVVGPIQSALGLMILKRKHYKTQKIQGRNETNEVKMNKTMITTTTLDYISGFNRCSSSFCAWTTKQMPHLTEINRDLSLALRLFYSDL